MSAAALGDPQAGDPRVAAMLDTLRRSFDGDAWHGPSLADLLGSVDARAAAARPVPGAHSIWELTLHVDAWTREVARRLRGGAPGEPVEGDWRTAPVAADGRAWASARAALDGARDQVLAAAAAIPADQLDRPVAGGDPGDDHPRAPTYAAMLSGLAEHNAYHGGQIALLRRALAPPA